MADKHTRRSPPLSIPLPFEKALDGLLRVKPEKKAIKPKKKPNRK
jgi:hypothetical protein